MLSIYIFLPLIGMSLVYFIVMRDFAWLPVWFNASGLPLSHLVEFAAYSFGLAWIFLKFERSIIFDASEKKAILQRVVSTTVVSVMFLFASSITGLDVDFRQFSQEYSLNIVYNVVRIFIIFFYFCLYGSSRIGIFLFCVGIGFFNAFSGSKASMLTPILIVLMAYGRLSLKTVVIASPVVVAGLLKLIPLHYFVRYFDTGLSAYQTAYIYYVSGIALIDYHMTTVWNALSGLRGYNPIIEYLNDTELAAGYNLTPTIVGEMMGSGSAVGLTIFCLICLYLILTRRLWPNNGLLSRKYFAANFFVLIGVMQSTLLDVFFYVVYFHMALTLIKVLKTLMSWQRYRLE